MLRLQWNALRAGDKVFVHERAADMTLVPGVVAMIQTLEDSNDIGIRVSPGKDGRTVVRPARLTVHLDPIDPAESCWRCDTIAAAKGVVTAT